MFARTFPRIFLILFAASMTLPGASDPLTDKMRQEDSRLDKPVTLIAPRIYVGELLERLSEQMGVRLTAGEKDGAADDQVMVLLKDVPLGDAMNALWSLRNHVLVAFKTGYANPGSPAPCCRRGAVCRRAWPACPSGGASVPDRGARRPAHARTRTARPLQDGAPHSISPGR